MQKDLESIYICPYTHRSLKMENGKLVSGPDLAFQITDGVPIFLDKSREKWSPVEETEYKYYQDTSDSYDAAMDWMFKSFYEDENQFREQMVDQLQLSLGARVLETGCGTCRDSIRIAKRIGAKGELFMQDMSSKMLEHGRKRFADELKADRTPQSQFFVGNATNLPFPDKYFDAVFHFGGINVFSDRQAALAEMSRVTKIGGRVVVGDEGLAPWHRETTYGKILQNSNALYEYSPPLELLPPNCRDVSLRWYVGNAYYVISFQVTDGEPKLDLDLPIQSRRGGTHRTRYYGVLEGINPEIKSAVKEAALKSGKTESEWLEQTLKKAIQK